MEPLVKPIEGVSAAQNRIFRRAEGRDDVETALKAGERIDDLQRDGLRIIQREDVIRLAGLWASRGAQIDFLDARKMDISSTQIREYIRKNQPFERLVPEAVADYIRARGLYGAKSGMELNG